MLTIIKWSKRHTVLWHTLNEIINFRAVQIPPNGRAQFGYLESWFENNNVPGRLKPRFSVNLDRHFDVGANFDMTSLKNITKQTVFRWILLTSIFQPVDVVEKIRFRLDLNEFFYVFFIAKEVSFKEKHDMMRIKCNHEA